MDGMSQMECMFQSNASICLLLKLCLNYQSVGVNQVAKKDLGVSVSGIAFLALLCVSAIL
jgi:hypothetical protein